MKPFNNDLIAQYDIGVRKMQYNRSNYYLDTNKGQYLLRKVTIPKEQIMFEYEVNRQLISKGFQHLKKLYLTKNQSPYAYQQDRVYILQAYEEVVDIDFKNEEDLKYIISILAEFHKIAQHIEVLERPIENVSMKNIYEYFQKRSLETKKMRHNIRDISQKSRFEIMFNKTHQDYFELEQRAMEMIDKDISIQLIEKAKKNHTIVHNEYTYHAVSKAKNGMYIMNHLDMCNYNIQLFDLSNVLIKVMQKNDWDIQLLAKLVECYDTIQPLSKEEYSALKAMLIFPEKFASICHKYTSSKRRNNYSMFEMKWENMLVYREEQLKAAKDIALYL